MNIYADSTVSPVTGQPTGVTFSTSPTDFLYAHIFSSQAAWQAGAAATQELKYSVSGAYPVALGDKIGSLQVDGYISTTNHCYAV